MGDGFHLFTILLIFKGDLHTVSVSKILSLLKAVSARVIKRDISIFISLFFFGFFSVHVVELYIHKISLRNRELH